MNGRTLTLASLAGLAVAGLAARRVRTGAMGSRALPGSPHVYVLPDLEPAWNAWLHHRVDTPIAWYEDGSGLCRDDAYTMRDAFEDYADFIGWDSQSHSIQRSIGGYPKDDAEARGAILGELDRIATVLSALSFPLVVYRGVNILVNLALRRANASFLAKRQTGKDHGHWSTDVRVARHFANGTHDASVIQGGLPHVYHGIIASASDVYWGQTISAYVTYSDGREEDPQSNESEIYAKKIQDIQEIT